MHIENFEIALKKAESWYKKNLTSDQIETYYNHLQFIPDVAIEDIMNENIKSTKPMPGNFPTINDLIKGWYKWREDNPDMIKKRERQSCQECFDSGWLWFKPPISEGEYPYEYIVGCEFCKNWKIDVGRRRIPLSNRGKLKARGYIVYPYEYKVTKHYKSIDEMTNDIGEVPF